MVQLHGGEDSSYIDDLRAARSDISIIQAVQVGTADDLALLSQCTNAPDLYLLDNIRGGSGESFDWSLLNAYTAKVPFLLAGGIGLQNIDEVIRLSSHKQQLLGIDINSKVELSPGIKDIKKVQAISERIRA